MDYFRYSDEDDKCYGIAGMAIGLVISGNEHIMSSLSLDANADEVIFFTNDYYFSGDPKMSPKESWQHIVRHFEVSMGMLIANVMCRHYVLKHKGISPEIKTLLYNYLSEEGNLSCSLEKDEIQQMFDKAYNYYFRVFNHQGVQSIARDFVSHVKKYRKLTRNEMIEQLHKLQSI